MEESIPEQSVDLSREGPASHLVERVGPGAGE